jgi:hypothetical protein
MRTGGPLKPGVGLSGDVRDNAGDFDFRGKAKKSKSPPSRKGRGKDQAPHFRVHTPPKNFHRSLTSPKIPFTEKL